MKTATTKNTLLKFSENAVFLVFLVTVNTKGSESWSGN